MGKDGGKKTESRQNNLFAKHTTWALATYWVHWKQGKTQDTSLLVFFITGMGLFQARKEEIKVWRAQEKIIPIIHTNLKNLLSCCKNEKWELIATDLHLQKNANLILQIWHYQDVFRGSFSYLCFELKQNQTRTANFSYQVASCTDLWFVLIP